jgi:hypothetical protein
MLPLICFSCRNRSVFLEGTSIVFLKDNVLGAKNFNFFNNSPNLVINQLILFYSPFS